MNGDQTRETFRSTHPTQLVVCTDSFLIDASEPKHIKPTTNFQLMKQSYHPHQSIQ